MGNLGKIGKPQKSRKHKKLKSVDPFNNRPKVGKNGSIDKAPKGKNIEEQELSRSMKEFIRNREKMKKMSHFKHPKKKNAKINDFQSNDDRKGMTRPIRAVPEFHRKKGEKDFHFVMRAEKAAKEVIGESKFEDKYKLNANPTQDELDEKKKIKDQWKAKKAERRAKIKRKRKGENLDENLINMEKKNHLENLKRAKETKDFSDLKDNIEFGEVALAPPSITVKPRKTEGLDERNKRNNLLLASMTKTENKRNNKASKTDSLKKAKKLKSFSALEKQKLLKERQKAVDQYRKLKAGNLGKLT